MSLTDRKRQLSLELSYSSLERAYNLEFFLKRKAEGDGANKTLFERIDFTEAEIFEMRYSAKMAELAEEEKAKIEGENGAASTAKKNLTEYAVHLIQAVRTKVEIPQVLQEAVAAIY